MKCKSCKKNIGKRDGVQVYKKSTDCADVDQIVKYVICKNCLKHGEDFAYCSLCGDEAAFHTSDLVSDGFSWYCKEHKGEIMDDEERESWMDFAGYINDPNH